MLLFRIVSDSTDGSLMSYNMGVDLVDAPWKLHREQTAPNDTASGRLSQGVKRCYKLLRLVRSAPKETSESTYQQNKWTHLLNRSQRSSLPVVLALLSRRRQCSNRSRAILEPRSSWELCDENWNHGKTYQHLARFFHVVLSCFGNSPKHGD